MMKTREKCEFFFQIFQSLFIEKHDRFTFLPFSLFSNISFEFSSKTKQKKFK